MRIDPRQIVFRLTAAAVFCSFLSFGTGSLAQDQPQCDCSVCGPCQVCLGSWPDCECSNSVAPVTACVYAGYLFESDPAPGAYPNPACVGQNVQFYGGARNSGGTNMVTTVDGNCNTNVSVYPVAGFVQWTWTLSTGESGTGGYVTRSFATPGTYTCTFTATAINGVCGPITISQPLSVTVQPPRCDNPHLVSDTIYECLHDVNDPDGTPCSTSQFIQDVINTWTCDNYPTRTCPPQCNVKVGTGPEVYQYVYDGACPGGYVHMTDWHTIYVGCTDCQPELPPWRVACTTSATTGALVDIQTRGTRKEKCP
jgi:hypothetical protein